MTFHLKTCKDPMEVIDYIHSIGIKVGMAINPDEEVKELLPYIPYLDEVLVMSVVPGKGGQSFMSEVLPKIDELIELKVKNHFIIAIDGGINGETVNYLKDYPVDMVISGSYVTESSNYEGSIQNLHI
jgi:ribulose-phosphate 3-epimerase